MGNEIHPAPVEFNEDQLKDDPILRYFHYLHLPAALQIVSAPFCKQAAICVQVLPRNAERSVALRKLLEAKDAAVRANAGALPKSQTFVDRIADEYNALREKTNKLKAFIDSDTYYSNLLPRDRALLHVQHRQMNEYLVTLGERYTRAIPEQPAAGFEQVGDVKIVGGDKSETPVPFSDDVNREPKKTIRFGHENPEYFKHPDDR